MNWKIEFDLNAAKEFRKLDLYSQKKISKYLHNHILTVSHPKDIGKSLKYSYAGLWRYRVDTFRIICHIEEDSSTILILKIGKRDEVY